MSSAPTHWFGQGRKPDEDQTTSNNVRARILVVDDSEPARESLAELLCDAGYQVDIAADGREALSHVGEQAPDLIISDVAMPNTDGFSLVEQLRQLAGLADTPIILVSGTDDTTRRITGLDLGADDYLPKPIQFGELLARVRLHLRRAHRLREIVARTHRDELTGLLNRGGLLGVLERERERARRHATPLALLVIDVDDFKSINDTLGHVVGDEVLSRIAQYLVAAVRTTDRVARFGGDEFLIVAPDTDSAAVEALVERITHIQSSPFLLRGDIQLTVKLSVGWAIDDGTLTTEELFTRADNAMYRQKGLRSRTMH